MILELKNFSPNTQSMTK